MLETRTHAMTQASEASEGGLSGRFGDALGYVAQAHGGQIRRADGRPYIAHLLRVSGSVIQEGGSEDEAIAALLHDAAEDQGGLTRLEDIRQRYGDRVGDVVEECTDTFADPKPPWRRRKELHLRAMDRCSPSTVLVLLADKLDNARTMLREHRVHGEGQWERSGKEPGDVRWYYRALADRLPPLRPGPLADELVRACAALDLEIAGDPGARSA
jgi:(p)ppGpp synthase/HD superfamily hydrolase